VDAKGKEIVVHVNGLKKSHDQSALKVKSPQCVKPKGKVLRNKSGGRGNFVITPYSTLYTP
jgi:hypothetical protein